MVPEDAVPKMPKMPKILNAVHEFSDRQAHKEGILPFATYALATC